MEARSADRDAKRAAKGRRPDRETTRAAKARNAHPSHADDFEAEAETQLYLRRLVATVEFGLPPHCRRPACRRARMCIGAGAACLAELKPLYQHRVPAFMASVRARLRDVGRL